nr:MbtH family NRPS accessory protein [Mycolicibacterium celeriflavum]
MPRLAQRRGRHSPWPAFAEVPAGWKRMKLAAHGA